MPVVSRFYGIVISMYFQQSEHNPPHIHAIYGEEVGVIAIESSELLNGSLPPKALSMTQEWIQINKTTLLKMWNTQKFTPIPPLQ